MNGSNPVIMQMRDITKSFPGVKALTDVSITVRAGEVHSIVGENGAGKSTLMKIMTGVHSPDSGTIEFDGSVVEFGNPVDAQRHGIGMVYQELNLVPDLSVAENISLGRMPSRASFVRKKEVLDIAKRALGDLEARIDPEALVGDLTVSQQQLVEIAKVYAAAPRVVIFDEPTSSLSEHEATILFRVIERMRERGIAVLYISHRLREVLDISEVVTVLRDGRHVETRPIENLTAGEMIRLMVGRELTDIFPKRVVPIGDTVLRVTELTREGSFANVSFDVRAGEILGFAGLVGAGRTEVARAIFGLDRADSGTVAVNGKLISSRRPAEGVAAGIGYVPEDRKSDGIVPDMTIGENISMSVLSAFARAGFVRRSEERTATQSLAVQLGVQPPNIDRKVSTLSGGNQQKVVLAKWLATKPTVLILDEPTRGVDVGAKADIHEIIGQLAEQGVAIVLISSELPEVLAVSDRVLVLHEGTVTALIDRADATEQRVMNAATGEEAA